MLSAIFLIENKWNRWIPLMRKMKASPKILLDFNGDKDDPNDYTSLISMLRFGTTSKTTLDNRHAQTNKILSELAAHDEIAILDIGASDGVTSMNFMQTLNAKFGQFYITDYNLNAHYIQKAKTHYLFDVHTDECVLVFNDYFAFKPNISNFVKNIFSKNIKALQKQKKQFKKIMLLHPEVANIVKTKSNITAMEYNIFENWQHEKVDLIKVANLLNRVYFSDEQILQAIENAKAALKEQGILAIIHNLGEEKSSIYRKEGNQLKLIHEINDGVAIKDIVNSKETATL